MADQTFPVSLRKMQRDLLRAWAKHAARTGDFIVTGFYLTDGGGLNASASAGTAVAGGTLLDRTTATTLALTASATNHIFLGLDEASLDTVLFTVNTTGTPPSAPYIKLGTVTTGGAAITSIDNIRSKASEVYDRVDPSGRRTVGEVIAEGRVVARTSDVTTGTQSYGVMPGVIAPLAHNATPTAKHMAALTGVDKTAAGTVDITPMLARGTKLYIKGRYTALADAPFDNAFERFAIGVVFGQGSLANATLHNFANETEGTRDDIGTIAVIVDDSENIQKYNCAAAGDASYTDSTHNADLSAGMDFEIIVECPTTGNTPDDLIVTISARDNTGTMRVVHSAVNPAETAATLNAHVVLILNQNAIVDNLVYKILAAA